MKTERQVKIEQLKQELQDLMWEEAEEMALSTKAKHQDAVQEILKFWNAGHQMYAIREYRSKFSCDFVEAHRTIVQLLKEQK